jgi:hypothetical protein
MFANEAMCTARFVSSLRLTKNWLLAQKVRPLEKVVER